jgi:4-hydroxybenzoate polyprenyltransferase
MKIQLLPILVVASLSILLYARFAKKVPYLSEPLCTLNYVLIAFGSFIVVAGFNQLSHALIFSLVPAGIMLGGNSLFINEIPDRGVDRKYGVKHSAVMLKTSKRIALYYLSFQAAAYLILVSGLILRQLPPAAAVALATLPITPYIFYGIYNARTRKYGRYLAFQTAASFIFAVLLSVVYIVAV